MRTVVTNVELSKKTVEVNEKIIIAVSIEFDSPTKEYEYLYPYNYGADS